MKRRKAVWHVYMVACHDHSLYVGVTTDLDRRLDQHNTGKGGAYTASHRPVTLQYSETHPSESSAKRREAELKRWPRTKKLTLITR